MIILPVPRKKMEMDWLVLLNNKITTISSNSKSLSLLTIPEVALKIKFKDFDATKKWLQQKNITILRDRKPYMVYEIDVDCEIDKGYVKDLRRKYPNDWEEIYKKIAKDDSVYEMVVLSLSGEVRSKPMTKIRPSNVTEHALLKKYSA